MLHENLTKIIIGCAMEVHRRLRNGFQEVIYQRALEIEMKSIKLDFQRELKCRYFIVILKLAPEELISLLKER